MPENKTEYQTELEFLCKIHANPEDIIEVTFKDDDFIGLAKLLSKFKQHLIDLAKNKIEGNDDEYSRLHDLAESLIKAEADKMAHQSDIRTSWEDQDIEVQYMIIGAMIDFALLVNGQKFTIPDREQENMITEADMIRVIRESRNPNQQHDINVIQSPQAKVNLITDEEIEEKAKFYLINENYNGAYRSFQDGAKWMQEQLKNK